MLEPLTSGFALFFTPESLLAVGIGTIIGLVLGVLPGLGPFMGIILALPVAFQMSPVPAMGLLISIYVGGACGGAITAILIRIPGTPAAAATLLDGHPMRQRGKAKEAVGLAIAASSLGGLIGGVLLIFFSPILAEFALRFGPPEYFALTLAGLAIISLVSPESKIKGFIAGSLGLLLATIGYDSFASELRFTFGLDGLLGGINIVAVVVGVFAMSEIITQTLEGSYSSSPKVPVVRPSFGSVINVLRDPINLVRSSFIGTFIGALPGTGPGISAFTAYAITKARSKTPEEFGKGTEQGVIATESANNATVGGTLIPTLALAVPGDPVTAILLGALILLGLTPGPSLFLHNQDVAGGIFLAYISANIFLLFVGVLLTPVFVLCIKLKKSFLLPLILLVCLLGVYSIESAVFDLWVMLVFGVFGFFLRRYGYPLAPFVVGMVLSPILESNFRRALVISGDDYSIFVDRPISFTILVALALALVWVLTPKSLKDRYLFRKRP